MPAELLLKGKTAIVTGAGGGIGSATAIRFAQEGCTVVCTDVNEAAVKTTAESINAEFPGRAIALRVDVSRSEEVQRSIAECVRQFGRLDIYFSNAGVLGKFVPIEMETDESFQRTMHINTFGSFLAIKHASEAMKKTGGGSIILTSSIASIRADLTPLQYAASKGALVSMMISANDRLLLDKVRINCILPGGVMTDMAMGVARDIDEQGYEMKGFDFKRYPHAEPEEIAAVVTFLASDQSSAIKGQSIVADGGMANSMGSQPAITKKKPKKAKL